MHFEIGDIIQSELNTTPFYKVLELSSEGWISKICLVARPQITFNFIENTDGIFILASRNNKYKSTMSPYYHVIEKIKSMDQKRKELGYAF